MIGKYFQARQHIKHPKTKKSIPGNGEELVRVLHNEELLQHDKLKYSQFLKGSSSRQSVSLKGPYFCHLSAPFVLTFISLERSQHSHVCDMLAGSSTYSPWHIVEGEGWWRVNKTRCVVQYQEEISRMVSGNIPHSTHEGNNCSICFCKDSMIPSFDISNE
jgi:hypothetical protein